MNFKGKLNLYNYLLQTPLARMMVEPQKGLLDGKWELNLPVHATGKFCYLNLGCNL